MLKIDFNYFPTSLGERKYYCIHFYISMLKETGLRDLVFLILWTNKKLSDSHALTER